MAKSSSKRAARSTRARASLSGEAATPAEPPPAVATPVLRRGAQGDAVERLQQRLRDRGFSPGALDGKFGAATEAAVLAFQRSEGLLVDGIAGPRTLARLKLVKRNDLPSALASIDTQVAAQMFPNAPFDNLDKNLPVVLRALDEAGLRDRPMVLVALATIRAESDGFAPISEFQSRLNTSPGGHPFDLYDFRRDLGNQGPPDGERFRGRGFVQLTGRDNYARYGQAIGANGKLEADPDLANDPVTAARLLAAFLKSKERGIKEALLRQDLAAARRLVNGGSHGVDRFTEAYRTGEWLVS